jgi:hypothetical protein
MKILVCFRLFPIRLMVGNDQRNNPITYLEMEWNGKSEDIGNDAFYAEVRRLNNDLYPHCLEWVQI